MRRIFLITDSFPFGVGEQFLESEIGYLSLNGSVCILPKSAKGEPRTIPDSVTIDTRLIDPRGGIQRGLAAASTSAFYAELARVPSIVLSPRKLKKLIYFISGGYRQASRLRELLDQSPEEEITLYSYWAWESAYSLALVGGARPGVRLVCRAHRFDVYEEPHLGRYTPLRKSYLKSLDAVCCVSDDGMRYMESNYGLPRSVLQVARLGVHEATSLPPIEDDQIVRIVSCSYLVPVKRVDRIVHAIAELESMCEGGIRWTHFGDGPERGRLEDLAARTLTRTDVEWLGQRPNGEVLSLYANETVHVLVNTSESEGIPVSIMEAHAHGIPAIAPDVGGVREIVSNRNGHLLPSDFSAEELAQAILDVSARRSPSFRRRILSEWAERYSADKNFRQFAEQVLCDSMATNEGSPP